MTNIEDNMNELFNDHEMFHSELQQDYFITAKSGLTTYGQYKQALRELYSRWRTLKELAVDLELLKIDIEEMQCKQIDDYFEVKRNALKLKQKQFQLQEKEFTIKETLKEAERFYVQSCVLKNEIGELTKDKRRELDYDMWYNLLKRQAAVDLISGGRVRNGTIETIMCLPKQMRTNILNEIKDNNSLITWFENYEDSVITNLPKLDFNSKLFIEMERKDEQQSQGNKR